MQKDAKQCKKMQSNTLQYRTKPYNTTKFHTVVEVIHAPFKQDAIPLSPKLKRCNEQNI